MTQSHGLKILRPNGSVLVGGDYWMPAVVRHFSATDFNRSGGPYELSPSGTPVTFNFPELAGCTVELVLDDDRVGYGSGFDGDYTTLNSSISYGNGYPSVSFWKNENRAIRRSYRLNIKTEPVTPFGLLRKGANGEPQAGTTCAVHVLAGKYTASPYLTLPPASAVLRDGVSNLAFYRNFENYNSGGYGWATHRVVMPFTEVPSNSCPRIYTTLPSYPAGIRIHSFLTTGDSWVVDMEVKGGFVPTVYAFVPLNRATRKVSAEFGITIKNALGGVIFDTTDKMLATLPSFSAPLTQNSSTNSDVYTVAGMPADPIMNTFSYQHRMQIYQGGDKNPLYCLQAWSKLWSKTPSGVRCDWNLMYNRDTPIPDKAPAASGGFDRTSDYSCPPIALVKEIASEAMFT